MIGARCIVELPKEEFLPGTIIGEDEDVTPTGGSVWKIKLDKPYLRPCGTPCTEMHANKRVVHLEQ